MSAAVFGAFLTTSLTGTDTGALGAGNPVLRLLGVLWHSLSPHVACPVEHYPCSRELRTRTMACTTAIWGGPDQPLAGFEAKRRLLAQLACPQVGMKAELCSPGITPGKQSLQLMLAPQPSCTGASKLETVPWKLCANMQIISLCRWHEVARTEQLKAWQRQKWGK